MKPHDVEAAVCSYLRARLGGVKVATDVPNPRPAVHVRVTRTGGSPSPPIPLDPAVVLVEAWAPRRADAFDLAAEAYDVLTDAPGDWLDKPGGAWCYDADPSGPVHYPDPDSKSARAQFVAVIHVSMED